MRIKLLLLSIFTLCFIRYSANANSYVSNMETQSITITTFSFTADIFFPLTTDALIELCKENNNCTTTQVTDKNFLVDVFYSIDSLLDQDTLSRESSGIDVRMVCLLERSGSRIDTVSFGNNTGLNPPAMKVNNKYYRLDKNLLRTLAIYVPETKRKGVLRYIDIIVPRYEEMLKNYYREHPEEMKNR